MNPQTRRLLSLTAAVLIAVFGLSMAAAQTPFEIHVFVDLNALTVYVPPSGAVSLNGLAFQVVMNGTTQTYRLQDFAAFGIDFDNVPTPVCFRLLESGANTPLPTQCPQISSLIQVVSRADVFWYDGVNNTYRAITVKVGNTPIGICPSGISDCPVTIIPPTHTPSPTVTNTPEFTSTPTLTPMPEFTLTPTPFPRFGSSNTDWTPQITTVNGIDVALVPPGCFTMGSADFDDAPPHEQCLDEPFYIGVTEVTNAQYARCVDDGACTPPSDQIYFADRDYADYPVIYVDWFQARDFAAWWGGRLPTEREWEYAARGVDSWEYPWGDDWDAARTNTSESGDGYDFTSPVGSFTEGASWVGVFDMSGNVWEWTHSLYDDYPYDPDDGREADTGDRTGVLRMLRGGSWDNGQVIARAARRSWNLPSSGNDDIGFRVVLGAPPT